MEITKMRTKLHRIDELLRKKSKYTPESLQIMPEEVQKYLQNEMDQLTSENQTIKNRNDKLRAIEQGFGQQGFKKPPPKSKTMKNKYSHVKGKLGEASMKQSDTDFLKLTEALKI